MKNKPIKNYDIYWNEILEALIKSKLSGRELRIFLATARKTVGWHKISDWISNSQLSQMTGIGISHINEIINNLKEKKIIKRKKIGYKAYYSIQTDYKKWRTNIKGSFSRTIKVSPETETTIYNKKIKDKDYDYLFSLFVNK
jgi:phage replication O-like protein O